MKGFKNVKAYIHGKGIIKTNIGIENDKIIYIGDNLAEIENICEIDGIIVAGFIDERLSKITLHLGKKSSGIFSISSPRKSFTCVDIIKIAIPFVNPTTSGRGIYLMAFPIFANPIIIRNIPAIMVAIAKDA